MLSLGEEISPCWHCAIKDSASCGRRYSSTAKPRCGARMHFFRISFSFWSLSRSLVRFGCSSGFLGGFSSNCLRDFDCLLGVPCFRLVDRRELDIFPRRKRENCWFGPGVPASWHGKFFVFCRLAGGNMLLFCSVFVERVWTEGRYMCIAKCFDSTVLWFHLLIFRRCRLGRSA